MVERNDDGEVRAAGGVVWRPSAGQAEVLLVHRPHHDDWTFPKGKADPGETDEECAVREVEEETGLRCGRGDELPPVRYFDGYDRRKVVRYWLMQPLEGEFAPHDEVDQVEWITLGRAAERLTYDHDREFLRAVAAVLSPRASSG